MADVRAFLNLSYISAIFQYGGRAGIFNFLNMVLKFGCQRGSFKFF